MREGMILIMFLPEDPRSQNFFLMSSPWGTLGIISFYLYFVQSLGPAIMMNRKPFELNRVMQLYNVTQIILCSYIFYKVRAQVLQT